MSWQDIVIFVGTAIISSSLLPALRDPQKPPLTTSLTIGTCLAVFVVVFSTAGFWLTAIINAITSSLWFTLALQRARQKTHPKVR